jgi:hypothetical protein
LSLFECFCISSTPVTLATLAAYEIWRQGIQTRQAFCFSLHFPIENYTKTLLNISIEKSVTENYLLENNIKHLSISIEKSDKKTERWGFTLQMIWNAEVLQYKIRECNPYQSPCISSKKKIHAVNRSGVLLQNHSY